MYYILIASLLLLLLSLLVSFLTVTNLMLIITSGKELQKAHSALSVYQRSSKLDSWVHSHFTKFTIILLYLKNHCVVGTDLFFYGQELLDVYKLVLDTWDLQKVIFSSKSLNLWSYQIQRQVSLYSSVTLRITGLEDQRPRLEVEKNLTIPQHSS